MLCAGLVGRDLWCPERCVGPACSVSNQRPCSVRVFRTHDSLHNYIPQVHGSSTSLVCYIASIGEMLVQCNMLGPALELVCFGASLRVL